MTNADIEKSAAMLWCSFCGKNQYQVRKMVAAPGTLSNALICNECVELCVIALRDPVTVENATPKSVEKTTDNQSGPLQCSFCCKTRYEVGKLIAGLDIYICNECVELCLVVQYQESKDNVDADQELPQDAASSPDVTPYCGFCGKERYGVAKLFEGRGAYICNECLEICEHAVRLKPDVSVRDVLSKTTPEEFSDDDLEGARRHSAAVLGPDHPDTLNSLSNLMATRRVAEDGVTLPGYAPVIPDAGARNDRLAAWRPDAPVPKEEALLLARIEALGNGNSLEKLVDLAKEYDAEGRHADAAVAYSTLLRLFLQLGKDAEGEQGDGAEVLLDTEDEITLNLVSNLAYSLSQAGDDTLALPLFDESLQHCESLLGREHHNTLISLNRLADCCQALGEFRRALPLYEDSLRRHEAVFGRDDPRTLKSLDNLAFCYKDLGDAQRALPLFEEARRRSDAVLGHNHPDALTSLNNLASCYYSLGDARRALPLLEVALGQCDAVLGRDHPDTLISRINLACCYSDLGDARRALPLYEDVWRGAETVFRGDNTTILASLNGLAACHWHLGDATQALPLFEAAHQRSEAVLGSNHADTVIALNNLATCLLSQESFQRALPLFEEAFRRSENLLGRDHPQTLTSINNLATCLQDIGQIQRAMSLHEDAFRRCEAVLGAHHPGTLASLNTLIFCHCRLNDLPHALVLTGDLLVRLGTTRSRDGNWIEHVAAMLGIVEATRSEGGGVPIPDWQLSCRGISKAFVQDLDLADEVDRDRLFGPMLTFHRQWLELCVKAGAAGEIPLLLQALQNREMGALLAEELAAVEETLPEDDPRRQYQAVRRELRHLRLALGSGGDAPFGPIGGGRSRGLSGSFGGSDGPDLFARLKEVTGEYEDLRRQIARAHPDFRLVFDPPDLDWTRLRGELAADEAMVLLFEPPSEHDEDPGTEPRSAEPALANFLASVIDQDAARFVDVPELTVVHGLLANFDARRRAPAAADDGDPGPANVASTMAKSFGPITDRGRHVSRRAARLRRLFRAEDGDDGHVGDAPPPAALVAEEMEQALWAPLVAACPRVRRWHLVLHHAARNLPVRLGAPEGHEVLVHAGVAFYGLGREHMRAAAEGTDTTSAPMVASGIAVHADTARLSFPVPQTMPPASASPGPTQEIPFVDAEAALIRAIHGEPTQVVTGAATQAAGGPCPRGAAVLRRRAWRRGVRPGD